MAEPLKNSFGIHVPEWIAASMVEVDPGFDAAAFLADVSEGYLELELTPRARRISDSLAEHLPSGPATAIGRIVAALGPENPESELTGMEVFRYLPYVFFIADHGLDAYEEAMSAQYEITKRFSAEFSIRAFITRYPERTMDRLAEWALDPNVHVRRLVSEGTRPRLPWAARLPQFQADPGPVLELLELLRDDPEEYVRRSVANNLNDIAKDHPQSVTDLARRWWSDAGDDRRRLLRHALRTLVKEGDPVALEILGYAADSPVTVAGVTVDPPDPRIGDRIRIAVSLTNPSDAPASVLADVIVNFVKANGSSSPKVFKGAELTLEPGAGAQIRKNISLAQHTTRKHYPGRHLIEVQVNGSVIGSGGFTLLPSSNERRE